jgi:phage shock protein A
MPKQSFLGRVESLADGPDAGPLGPADALDRRVTEHAAAIAVAHEALAEATETLRALDRDLSDAREAADEWGTKAVADRQRSDQMRAAGRSNEAARLAVAAESAAAQQRQYGDAVAALEPLLLRQRQSVSMIRANLTGLQDRHDELRRTQRALRADGASR